MSNEKNVSETLYPLHRKPVACVKVSQPQLFSVYFTTVHFPLPTHM